MFEILSGRNPNPRLRGDNSCKSLFAIKMLLSRFAYTFSKFSQELHPEALAKGEDPLPPRNIHLGLEPSRFGDGEDGSSPVGTRAKPR